MEGKFDVYRFCSWEALAVRYFDCASRTLVRMSSRQDALTGHTVHSLPVHPSLSSTTPVLRPKRHVGAFRYKPTAAGTRGPSKPLVRLALTCGVASTSGWLDFPLSKAISRVASIA
jgi:hypothetical protein